MIRIDKNASLRHISTTFFSTAESWIQPAFTADSYELIYIMSGEVYIESEGVRYTLSRGETLLLDPGENCVGFAESTGLTELFKMKFNSDNVGYFGLAKNTDTKSDYITINLFREQMRLAGKENVPDYAKTLLCGNIIARIASLAKTGTDAKTFAFTTISEWVRINSTREIKVEDVAGEFGYNKTYISRLFKKYAGVSLKEYISSERIKLAKELLLTTDKSIKSIAEELGFDDENLFVKFFKYHEKVSPTKLRQSYFK